MMFDVKQFILNSGEEVMCEVLEWVEEGHKEIIVKNAMCIALVNTSRDSYYSFRPWVHYAEGPDEYIIINTDHVVATASPNHLLLHQYQKAVQDMHYTHSERIREFKQETARSLKEAGEVIEKLMSDKIHQRKNNTTDSADSSNIIKFPL